MMKKNTFDAPRGFQDPRALAGLPADAPLAVALSGGADSVALLSLLSGTGNVSAVHVHHGIRAGEADRDADFCRALCAELGVALTVLHIDAPALSRELGVSLETAARDGRYAAITAYLEENGIPLLVTAHHADDQLETLLLNLLRGSGLSGLCGIPVCRPLAEGIFVARPMLTLTREEILAYLSEQGLDFVTDSTNAERCCTRNRLRLDVIPLLRELYPAGARSAARAALSLREDEALLEQLADEFFERFDDGLPISELAALPRPIFARVLRRLLPEPPERVHIDAVFELCQKATPNAVLSLPEATVGIENGRLRLLEEQREPTEYEIPLKMGENPLGDGGDLAILLPFGENCETQTNNRHKYHTSISLCSAKIVGELTVRPRRAGDLILSGGMHHAVRRLPELSRFSPKLRARMPLVVDDEGVLAVPFSRVRDGANKRPDLSLYLFFN